MTQPGDRTPEPLNSLDFRHKVFGDAIHGDIWFSALETALIDTPDFQRLRRIQQLGTTSLVYPTAEHSRFTHSLGTVYMAQQMMDAMDSTLDGVEMLTPHVQRTVRLLALLHDIGHVPFGHTTEDETQIFGGDEKHDSPATFERYLSAESRLGILIADSISEEERERVQAILSAKGDAAIRKLEYPFAADIVGNTLCADLLDYLVRDATACGLRGRYHKRLLEFLALARCDGVVRVVLTLRKDGEVRRDVISEFIGLLQRRYELAERVYYHHTKMFTSGMVSGAIQAALKSKDSPEFGDRRFLEGFGDASLLQWLCDSCKDGVANRLARAILDRRKYKAVYKLSWRESGVNDGDSEKVEEWAKTYNREADLRWQMERRLEIYNRLAPGSVVIYCPNPKMQRKVAETLVLWRESTDGAKTAVPFFMIPDKLYKQKVESLIDDHARLWKAYVLVDTEQVAERGDVVKYLASDCEREFGLLNEFEGLRQLGLPPPAERRLEDWDAERGAKVTLEEMRALMQAVAFPRAGEQERLLPTNEELDEALAALRAKRLELPEDD